MATKLGTLFKQPRRSVEQQDILAAFRRCAGKRWGERIALEPVRVARGTLTVRCPSPLWRTELLFQSGALLTELHAELPEASLRRITAVLS